MEVVTMVAGKAGVDVMGLVSTLNMLAKLGKTDKIEKVAAI